MWLFKHEIRYLSASNYMCSERQNMHTIKRYGTVRVVQYKRMAENMECNRKCNRISYSRWHITTAKLHIVRAKAKEKKVHQSTIAKRTDRTAISLLLVWKWQRSRGWYEEREREGEQQRQKDREDGSLKQAEIKLRESWHRHKVLRLYFLLHFSSSFVSPWVARSLYLDLFRPLHLCRASFG